MPANLWETDGGVYFGQRCAAPLDPDQPLSGDWSPTGELHRYTGDRHLVTIGPNGSGKTRRLLIPNLHYLRNWSVVVIDPKGTLAAQTGPYRAALPGHKVVVIDPFAVLEKNYPGLVEACPALKSAGFNPVASLDPESDDFVDDAKGMADALITVDDRGEKYWSQSAQSLVKGLTMALRVEGGEAASLRWLRALVGAPLDVLAEEAGRFSKLFGDEHPAIAACLNPFAKLVGDGRTQATILSTAQTQTDWLDSPPITASLSAGGFDFGSLKEQPTTVYLILPPNRLATHATWLRLMIAAVLQPLLKSVRPAKVPVLMMLDEFAQMGHIAVIENNMGLMREYGVKLWPIFQDLAQAQDLYEKRWESFIGNAGVLQSFAPQDSTTREYLSKLSGQRLYWLKTVGTNTGQSVGPQSTTSTGMNEGWSNMQGPIYWPQGLAAMKAGQAVLFAGGRAPRSWLPDPSEIPEVAAMLAASDRPAKAA